LLQAKKDEKDKSDWWQEEELVKRCLAVLDVA
jgi:hypothetical protein